MSKHAEMPRSAWIFPALSVVLFAAVTAAHYEFTASPGGLVFAAVLLAILFGTVFAAVHHAEVIAHRVGEPYGTLVLTLAVTRISGLLMLSTYLSGPACEWTPRAHRNGTVRLHRDARFDQWPVIKRSARYGDEPRTGPAG